MSSKQDLVCKICEIKQNLYPTPIFMSNDTKDYSSREVATMLDDILKVALELDKTVVDMKKMVDDILSFGYKDKNADSEYLRHRLKHLQYWLAEEIENDKVDER